MPTVVNEARYCIQMALRTQNQCQKRKLCFLCNFMLILPLHLINQSIVFYHSWDGISLFVFSNLDFANCLTSILLDKKDKCMKKIMDEKKWVWEMAKKKKEVEVEGLSAHPHILAFHQCSKRRRWWRVLVSIHLIPLTRSY